MRLPAEWETQRATLMAWPGPDGDWAGCLPEIRAEYASLIDQILARQPVIILVQTAEQLDTLPFTNHSGLNPVVIEHNDTWCRDYGPVGFLSRSGRAQALDFKFDAWGGKYSSELDDKVNSQLIKHPLLADFDRVAVDLELEGGALESDGKRRLLINWFCLERRLPQLSRSDIADRLKAALYLDTVLGIDVPALPGDDTDGHIDTIARFAGPDCIVYQRHRDSEWTRQLESQLQALRRADGQGFRLVALPCVESFDPALPANYANFLFINGACLVPIYDVPSDSRAISILAELLPDREVAPIPARTMITQFGGPHCATMHIPEPIKCHDE